MAFPGPYASIIRNEAGEPIGWDNNYPDEPPEYDDFDREPPPKLIWCSECQTQHYDDESCDFTVEEGHTEGYDE